MMVRMLVWKSLVLLFILFISVIAERSAVVNLRAGASSSSSSSAEISNAVKMVEMDNDAQMVSDRPSDIDIVFSDLDGTLIHYPDDIQKILKAESHQRILQLPPSSTGLVGVISSRTLQLTQEIRRKGTKLVLVSGMRLSTLLKRLPYLPKADAYCCEAGGRIFYPCPEGTDNSIRIDPIPFDGATREDLEHFFIVEDEQWRKQIEQVDMAGKDGYVGNDPLRESGPLPPNDVISLQDRKGTLWEHAQNLEKNGYVLDLKGYATCFRVNEKHQKEGTSLKALVDGTLPCPENLSTSTNLGCVDYYPKFCGKKNCCLYIASKFSTKKDALAKHCVCLCDDDNDIEMALACLHAYIPMTSSDSMVETIKKYGESKFTVTNNSNTSTNNDDDGEENIDATERALSLVLQRI